MAVSKPVTLAVRELAAHFVHRLEYYLGLHSEELTCGLLESDVFRVWAPGQGSLPLRILVLFI